MIKHIADEAEHIYIAYTEVLTIPKFIGDYRFNSMFE